VPSWLADLLIDIARFVEVRIFGAAQPGGKVEFL